MQRLKYIHFYILYIFIHSFISLEISIYYYIYRAKYFWIRHLIPSFTFRYVFIEASRVRKCGNVTSCNCGWSILNASVAQHVGSSTAASNYASPDINHRKYEGHWRNLSIDTLLPLRENSSTFLLKKTTLYFKMSTRNIVRYPFSPF